MNDLFLLIRKMKKGEKRYFKRFASRHIIKGKNNYVRLFDAIEKQKSYNEEEIRKVFRGEAFVNFISPAKYQLYRMILKSLQHLYEDSIIESKISGAIQQSFILAYRGLDMQAFQLLERTRVISEKYNVFPATENILHIQIFLLQRIYSDPDECEQKMKELYSKAALNLEQMKNMNEYNKLGGKVSLLMAKSEDGRNPAYRNQFREIAENPLFKREENALSEPAKIFFYNIPSLCFGFTGDIPGAYEKDKALVTYIENKKREGKIFDEQYIPALGNLLEDCLDLEKYEEFLSILPRLENMPASSYFFEMKIFQNLPHLKFRYYLQTCRFDDALKMIPEIQSGLLRFSESLEKKFQLQYQFLFANFYYIQGEYSRSLIYLNIILNDRSVDLREDIHGFARLLNLLLHFELGNEEILDSFVSSVYRFLLKKGTLYRTEQAVLDFLRRRMSRKSATEPLRRSLENLKEELEKISEDSFERKILRYFDFLAWLESKIQNRPLTEVLKDKLYRR